MFIINLKRNGVINSLSCLAFQQAGNRIKALIEQHHPECPCFITLAEYSSDDKAKEEFAKLVEALKLNKKYYEMGDENETLQ